MSLITLAALKKVFGREGGAQSNKAFEHMIDTLSAFPTENDLHLSGFLTTEEVLDGNTTAQTLLAAQGATNFINVKRAWVAVSYLTAAYATNTSLELLLGSTVIGEVDVLAVTADTMKAFTIADANVVTLNSALTVRVKTGDPITGDSPIGIFVDYSVDTDLVAQVPTA